MHQIRFDMNAHRLMVFARRVGSHAMQDTSYLFHSALKALFEDDAPRPFHTEILRNGVFPVHGYTRRSAEELAERVAQFADPEIASLIVKDTLCSKPMPTWAKGQRVVITSRVSPMVRYMKGDKRVEVDAFVHAKMLAGDKEIDRAEVYEKWAENWLTRNLPENTIQIHRLAVEPHEVRLCVRRGEDADRTPHTKPFADATIFAQLTILDPNGFSALLERGIGKQRAFGFGFVKVRPTEKRDEIPVPAASTRPSVMPPMGDVLSVR